MKNIAILTGRKFIAPVEALGKFTLFSSKGLLHIFSFPLQWTKIMDQVFFIGYKSIFVISLTGAFTGMVLGLQGYYSLVEFGAEGLLGSAVALSLIREMGPVLCAFMVIGRAGSAMTAEIGIMRISEQIDALQTMGINPTRFLVSPRMAGALISFPILTALFDVVGIFGGYITGSVLLGINKGIYFYRVESSIEMSDLSGGFIKAIVFAFLVSSICCYQGYCTHKRAGGFGAKGVSLSTTSAVVSSSVIVLVVDYILTSILL